MTAKKEEEGLSVVEKTQTKLVSIAVSMGGVDFAMGYDWFQDLFKPNYIWLVSWSRMLMALAAAWMLASGGYEKPYKIFLVLKDVYLFYLKVKNESLKTEPDKEDKDKEGKKTE